ncbi:MAG: hypothetical protein LBT57_02300 [Puniceicoccales bacterium]|nr:hypothetical protein [Puniceicoccales bacterium]
MDDELGSGLLGQYWQPEEQSEDPEAPRRPAGNLSRESAAEHSVCATSFDTKAASGQLCPGP